MCKLTAAMHRNKESCLRDRIPREEAHSQELARGQALAAL